MSTPRELMDRMKQAITTTDLELMMGAYGADPVLITPQGTYTGRAALEEYWTKDFATFRDTTLTFGLRGEVGDTAVDEWLMESTEVATGERSPLRGVDICQVADGLVVEHRFYFDT